MRLKNIIGFACVFILIGFIGWYFFIIPIKGETGEASIVDIPLKGPITSKKAELSGLAWVGDTLVLLPQYPENFGSNNGVLFAIPKMDILNYLDGKSKEPISPYTIKFIAPGLKDNIQNYEGFEAIGFLSQNIYLTIESGKNNEMMGYLISGTISSDLKEIVMDTSHKVEIPPAIHADNRTDEAFVIMQDKILTFFEINGSNLNPHPTAHVFGLNLVSERTISFPNLEYRVTDAALGPNGEIWVINNVSPNDSELFTKYDPLIEKINNENTFEELQQVERLVKLNFDGRGITLADVPPIQIKLEKKPRNWEGLVLLDNLGFLLVTDKSPDTLLGFIAMP